MQVIGYLFIGLVALALLRVAFQVVVIVALIVLLWSAIARPRETAACVFMFVAVSLIGQFPMAALFVLGLLGAAGWSARR